MEFGEHIPTSSDESILGRDVPTSDSEDRPPTRIPRGRQGRAASSGGGCHHIVCWMLQVQPSRCECRHSACRDL